MISVAWEYVLAYLLLLLRTTSYQVPVVDGVKHLPTGRYIHRDSRTAVSAYLILSDYASFIPIPRKSHPPPLLYPR
ncbi:hypothetical protein M747DRAFT_106035 [Aspergillus niger ATCC 13496]|uniref:Secreted protein n=1 Tax=Aspergillus niger ATCC 13496 TaxID=1353008 RepID=A0A370BN41_ASPNG|nr:hypothetical protein M747DRAFT_106035 [Aspergillus niger ATCC 13496]